MADDHTAVTHSTFLGTDGKDVLPPSCFFRKGKDRSKVIPSAEMAANSQGESFGSHLENESNIVTRMCRVFYLSNMIFLKKLSSSY